jgi:predicted MFS family arabinose efflux permease
MADEETNIRRPYAELGLVWLQIWQTVQTPDTADQSSPIRYPAIRPDLAGGESDAIQSTTRSANRWGYMTVATLATATSAENRKAVIAGTIGNVLEWYDFGVYGYFATTISQLFFPGDDKTVSLLKAFAVFGVGFVMRPVGSVLFGIYGDRFGRRLALSAVIFLMAFSTVAIGLLPTYAQAGVLVPILLVVFRLLQGLSAGGEWGGSTSYIVEYAPEGRRGFIGSWQQGQRRLRLPAGFPKRGAPQLDPFA